jgi:hypothetical protein
MLLDALSLSALEINHYQLNSGGQQALVWNMKNVYAIELSVK